MPTLEELKQAAALAQEALAAAEAEAAAASSGPPAPRTLEQVLADLLTAITSHLGNPPKVETHLLALLEHLKAGKA